METYFLALFMSNVDMLLSLASGILADMTQQRLEICLHFGRLFSGISAIAKRIIFFVLTLHTSETGEKHGV